MILDSGSEARLLWRSGDRNRGDVDALRRSRAESLALLGTSPLRGDAPSGDLNSTCTPIQTFSARQQFPFTQMRLCPAETLSSWTGNSVD